MGTQIILTIILCLVIGYFYLEHNLRKIKEDWQRKHYGETITPEMRKELDAEQSSEFIKTLLYGGGILLFLIISICMGANSWE